MKLLLLICSLLTVARAQAPSLFCRYYNHDQTYGCELTINNPNGFNNFTEIGGIHLEGFANADLNVIRLRSGSSVNIPQIICDTFPNIAEFDLVGCGITGIDDTAFSGCSNIIEIMLIVNRISSISAKAFVNLRAVRSINLDINLLTTLPENLFENQQNLTSLSLNNNLLRFPSLSSNGINEIATFAGLTNLQSLRLRGNNFTELSEDSFSGLGQLITLDISSNRLVEIVENAFRGLEGLSTLSLSNCRIRALNSNTFRRLTNLTSLDLNFNEFENIAPGTFASMPNLSHVALGNNRLTALRRDSFGSLTALRTVNLDRNIVNSLDRAIIDDAVNLETLNFSGNLCASNLFSNFPNRRAQYLPMLERCFRNMRYTVDATTENDGVYSFFEGPFPGIAVRVQSDKEVQIALVPFNFLWSPSIEIFIGTTNNSRSVIRINQETDVATVPTPNIIQHNDWNDFRVTWANHNVLVFSGNDTFPFMSFTMQDFYPVNFYGLRAVETRATWSIQPLQ